MERLKVTTRRRMVGIALCTSLLFTSTFFLAAQDAPDDPEAQFQRATRLFEEAEFREAIAAYDGVLAASDRALVARARKGKIRAALRLAEFLVAHREAERLSTEADADAEAFTLYGDALWANGLFDEADAAYARAFDLAPESSRAKLGLARSLATRSQLDEALTDALAVTAMAPDDPEGHALVGHIYERMNRFDEAADSYERYTELLPDSDGSTMGVTFTARVRLLRSFRGRTPVEIEGDGPGRVYRAPFRLINNKIVLQGRLNGRSMEFVLDTGSERTGISTGTARRARVATVASTLTAGVGPARFRRLELGRADRLEIGDLRMRNVPVSIRAIQRGTLPVWQTESFSPLSLGLSVVIDYERREVVLARELPDSEADFRLPMRMNRLPLVRGVLNSTHPAYFVVDTGGELISISTETAIALPEPPRRIPLRVFGMSGLDEGAFLMPGIDLDFDELAYRNMGLAVLDLRAPSVLLGFQLGGIVGHSFLGDYRVSMDVGRSELRLQKF